MFTIKTFPFNLLQENTYVVSDETHECVIIDCGAYYEEERKAITDYITGNGLRPTHLLATHGHWDHNLGIDTIFNAFGLRRKFPAVGRFFDKDEVIRFGNHELQVLKTPGHSPGSVVFYCAQEHIAFTGDTLFRMSVGRTDFEGGSYEALMNSLNQILANLPVETIVLPGHGPQSTIGEELRFNPYLQ